MTRTYTGVPGGVRVERRFGLAGLLALLVILGGPAASVADEEKYQFSVNWVDKGGRVEDWTEAL